MQHKTWRRLSGELLRKPLKEIIQEALLRERQQGYDIKVCIGTDSQVKSKLTTFATVVVVVRKGKGAFMFINREDTTRMLTVKERMLEEVARSIDIAYQLCPVFTELNVDMEVHADINTNPAFKSNNALKEAMGYILGMGFVFRAKPVAFASSQCADKMVH